MQKIIDKGNGKRNGKAPSLSLLTMANENEFWRQFNEMSATIARMDERVARLLEAETANQSRREAEILWRQGIENRLKALEGAGIGAWSWKKLGQMGLLVGILGAIIEAGKKLLEWLSTHWK